jgi:hypothetical protein
MVFHRWLQYFPAIDRDGNQREKQKQTLTIYFSHGLLKKSITAGGFAAYFKSWMNSPLPQLRADLAGRIW